MGPEKVLSIYTDIVGLEISMDPLECQVFLGLLRSSGVVRLLGILDGTNGSLSCPMVCENNTIGDELSP